MTLEQERGRTRTSFRGARTLDLDLILYGDRIVDDASLTIPHPRFRDRRFVLEPLASIAPHWVDPITGQTMRQLLNAQRP
jgi:2-amino-4-hydroxy-6-hydroxymethyldihydropteridine diphosphokinase